MTKHCSRVHIDVRRFVRVDGVPIARVVRTPSGKPRLQFCDKDRRRASERGSRFVEVSVEELAEAVENPDSDTTN